MKNNKNDKPETIYRYRPAKEQEIHALIDTKIWLSSPFAFDDPWDCSLNPKKEKLPQEAIDEIGKLRIACFTSRNDNTRMWSHYASEHTGFCIGYKTSGVSLDNWDIISVNYNNKIPSLRKTDDFRSPKAFELYKELVRTKSTDWKDQEEWRFISSELFGSCIEVEQDDIVSITFGLKMKKTFRERIYNLVGSWGIDFKEVIFDPKSIKPVVKFCDRQH
jgi:hypothetical protein